jgi:hypothetical protein
MYVCHQSNPAIKAQIAILEEDLRRAEDGGQAAVAAPIEERLVEYQNELDKRQAIRPK